MLVEYYSVQRLRILKGNTFFKTTTKRGQWDIGSLRDHFSGNTKGKRQKTKCCNINLNIMHARRYIHHML